MFIGIEKQNAPSDSTKQCQHSITAGAKMAAFAAAQQHQTSLRQQMVVAWQQQQIANSQHQTVMWSAATAAMQPRSYCQCKADWCMGGMLCVTGKWRKRKKIEQNNNNYLNIVIIDNTISRGIMKET